MKPEIKDSSYKPICGARYDAVMCTLPPNHIGEHISTFLYAGQSYQLTWDSKEPLLMWLVKWIRSNWQ